MSPGIEIKKETLAFFLIKDKNESP